MRAKYIVIRNNAAARKKCIGKQYKCAQSTVTKEYDCAQITVTKQCDDVIVQKRGTVHCAVKSGWTIFPYPPGPLEPRYLLLIDVRHFCLLPHYYSIILPRVDRNKNSAMTFLRAIGSLHYYPLGTRRGVRGWRGGGGGNYPPPHDFFFFLSAQSRTVVVMMMMIKRLPIMIILPQKERNMCRR